MFLDRLIRLNPALARAAMEAHQGGRLLANTYLIDADAVTANTQVNADAARRAGLRLYAMTKQFGRNPDTCAAIVAGGIESAVTVDMQDMEAVRRGPLDVGHVGHLVQPQRGTEDAVIATRPEVVTVFADEIAARIAAAARRAGVEQAVLLRVVASTDQFYFGHGGGFPLDSIEAAAKRINSLPGVRVVGVTTFPALLADAGTRQIVATPNFDTLRRAAERLRAAGFAIDQVNAPGTTSSGTMQLLADGGATHAEPGNGLHGTTPLMVFEEGSPELPAIVLVSEVSHLEGNHAYVYGAGLYVDRVLGGYELSALCGRDESILERRYPVQMAPDGAIHYYAKMEVGGRPDVRIGDTVVFCFRPQVFVTRARTQSVSGLRDGSTRLGEAHDVEARRVEGVS
jgi:predicted amino acid racemase